MSKPTTKKQTQDSNESKKETHIYADSPIEFESEDKFERAGFARHLSDCLLLPVGAPSIVVGIEGKYGEGKTSCINLVREVLAEDQAKPIIVEYSPWLISTLDSLIEGFFIQLATAVGKSAKGKDAQNTAKKILLFAKMLAPIKLIPGVEPWGSLVERVLSSVGTSTQSGSEIAELSLEEQKKDLQHYLRKLKRPIVVIVDDIDRLPPEDVRTVFQMLKAVANFPRVSYLAAYDPEPVAKALSYGDIYDGRAYLEKLIQISYRVPRASFIHRKDFLVNRVDCLFSMNFNTKGITESDASICSELFNHTKIFDILRCPRDIVRLVNRLHLVMSNIGEEVCFADIVAFETLALKVPNITQHIHDNPSHYTLNNINSTELRAPNRVLEELYNVSMASDDNKEGLIRKLGLENICPEEKSEAVESLLSFMFPQLQSPYFRANTNDIDARRIWNSDVLLKVLHGGIMSFTFSVVTAKRLLSCPDERQNIMNEWREEGKLIDWLNYVRRFFNGATITDPHDLCKRIIDEASSNEEEPPFPKISNQLGHVLYEMITALPDEQNRIDVLKTVVETKSIAVSLETLMLFLKDAGVWVDGVFYADIEKAKELKQVETTPVPYEDLYTLKNLWLTTVRSVANEKGILGSQRNPLVIFYRWKDLNDNNPEEVSAHIKQKMQDKDWLFKFTRCFDLEMTAPPPFTPADFIHQIRTIIPDDKHANALANAWENFYAQQKKNAK